jgi:hypothetical protein
MLFCTRCSLISFRAVRSCLQEGHQTQGENCVLLGCYTANSGNSLLTFRDNLSVPSSRGPETSVRITTTRCVRTQNNAVHILCSGSL